MRIMLLTSSLGPGGTERVATSLANAWVDRGDEVFLLPTFSGGGSPHYSVDPNVELAYLADLCSNSSQKRSKQFARRLWILRKTVQSWEPDIVLSFLPNVNVAAILATSFSRYPCVIGERSDPIAQPIGRFWFTACKILYRFADDVVVQTQSAARSLAKCYGGIDHISVVGNPVPAVLMNQKPDINRQNDRQILLSLGRLSDEKNVNDIITAFSRVASEFPTWDLHVFGNGPCLDDLIAQSEAAQLPGRIVFKGQTTQPWLEMAKADGFVMFSSFEGFPNALLEAMTIGLPSISSDCLSGPYEMTDQGRAGLLVPVKDVDALVAALRKLMGDSELRISLSQAARSETRKRYSMETILDLWDQVFQNVIARK